MKKKIYRNVVMIFFLCLIIVGYFILKGSNILTEKPQYKKSVEYIMEGSVPAQ